MQKRTIFSNVLYNQMLKLTLPGKLRSCFAKARPSQPHPTASLPSTSAIPVRNPHPPIHPTQIPSRCPSSPSLACSGVASSSTFPSPSVRLRPPECLPILAPNLDCAASRHWV